MGLSDLYDHCVITDCKFNHNIGCLSNHSKVLAKYVQPTLHINSPSTRNKYRNLFSWKIHTISSQHLQFDQHTWIPPNGLVFTPLLTPHHTNCLLCSQMPVCFIGLNMLYWQFFLGGKATTTSVFFISLHPNSCYGGWLQDEHKGQLISVVQIGLLSKMGQDSHRASYEQEDRVGRSEMQWESAYVPYSNSPSTISLPFSMPEILHSKEKFWCLLWTDLTEMFLHRFGFGSTFETHSPIFGHVIIIYPTMYHRK